MSALRASTGLVDTLGARLSRFGSERWVVAILVLAAAAGLVGALPFRLALVALALMLALIVFVVMRMAFASPLPTALAAADRATGVTAARKASRLPRLLYYGGVLTIGQLTFRLPLAFTLSDWLFFFSLVLAVLGVLVVHRRATVRVPIAVLLGGVLFGIGSLVSSLDAALPLQSVAIGARVVYIVTLWFWLGTELLRDVAQITTAVRLWTISAGLTGAGAVAQLLWGDVIPGATPSWGRMTGFTPHMTDLGGITCLALPPALWLVARTKAWGIQRLAGLATVAAIGAGLVLSGSVGSMLAAAVGVFVWLALGGVRLRAIAVVAVLTGVVAIPALANLARIGGVSPATRLEQVIESDGQEGSLWSRLEAYQAAWESIGRSPYVGAGLDDKSSRVDVMGLELLPEGVAIFNRHQVHNLLLGSWYGAGLLGVLGVLAILAGILHAGIASVARAGYEEERLLAVALLASFAGFVVFAQGTVVLYQRYGWIGSALLIAVWAQQSRRRHAAAGAGAIQRGLPEP